MEVTPSSETSVHTRTTRRHISENDFLHSHGRENLKSYILTGFVFPDGRSTVTNIVLRTAICIWGNEPSKFVTRATRQELWQKEQVYAAL
jgi:hypothetical protein